MTYVYDIVRMYNVHDHRTIGGYIKIIFLKIQSDFE